jgi:F1F0 ATPase subunit 2
MSAWYLPLASLAAGFLMGLAYFGGLWLTLRRLPTARHPAGMLAASLAVRLGLVTGGLLVVGGGSLGRLLLALAGLVAARSLLLARMPGTPSAQGGR